MKKIFTILTLLTTGYYTMGQISFGPRIGISSSKVEVDERFEYNDDFVNYDTEGSKVGFHAGAFLRVDLLVAYIQPEVLFTSSGGKVAIDSDDGPRDIQDYRFDKLDVPVMAGINIARVFRIQAGPKFSILLNSDVEGSEIYDEVTQNYNRATVGYQAGIGVDIADLYFDLKYEGNLSRFGDTVTFGNQEFRTDMRNSLFILILGINIL